MKCNLRECGGIQTGKMKVRMRIMIMERGDQFSFHPYMD
jgi:hypothetical protein